MGEGRGGWFLLPNRRSLWQVGVTTILLVAAALRFTALPAFPPGIAHDEVAEVLIAEGILAGHHAIFFQEAYGQEPLFLYLVAVMVALVGRSTLSLRFVTASVGLLTVAAGARWSRRLFGLRVGLMTASGIAVVLWPVFWSRVGLRGMLLPLTMLLGADSLWRSMYGRSGRRGAVWGGVWFGLSGYTYLAARAVPVMLVLFAAALLVSQRGCARKRWRAVVITMCVAAVTVCPLVVYLVRNKEAQSRVYEVDAPLQALRAGDPHPIATNLIKILGMFTFQGDATERNNVPLRPVFPEPVWGTLFYIGVCVALIRVREPRYVLALAWLGAMLLPSLATTEAPNFVRTLGALPAVMVFPSIGADLLLRAVHRVSPSWSRGLMLGFVAVLGVNAGVTARDYFARWPAVDGVPFVWQWDLAAVAEWLDAHPSVHTVTVGGLSATSMDDPSLDLLMRREDIAPRWCDMGSPLGSGGGLVIPQAGGLAIIPAIMPFADSLGSHLVDLSWDTTQELGTFRLGRMPALESSGTTMIRFAGDMGLLGIEAPEGVVRPGEVTTITTFWEALSSSRPDFKVFVHVADDEGAVVAQHDGLDCPSGFWHRGDQIVQVHPILLPTDLGPGLYSLRIGIYDRQTLDPYPLLDGRPFYSAGTIVIDGS